MKLLRLPIIVLFAYVFVLMGCGQKGPLYLPEKQTAPVITTEPAQINDASSQSTTKTEQIEKEQASPESTNEAAQ